jgi:hypothetical protein
MADFLSLSLSCGGESGYWRFPNYLELEPFLSWDKKYPITKRRGFLGKRAGKPLSQLN